MLLPTRRVVALALLFLASLVLGSVWSAKRSSLASQNVSTFSPPALVRIPAASLLESAWNAREHWDISTSTRALIAPHHLVASKEIASLFSSVPFKPSKVFVLSPDHFSRGSSSLTTSLATFVSPQATTTVDKTTVLRLLAELPDLHLSDTPFEKEHGVFALLPFLETAWPNTPVVPVIVKNKTSSSTLQSLSKSVLRELQQDPSALLVVSSDFSHYLPAELADFHDERTQEAIRALDAEEVTNLEVDVPGPLFVGLDVARSLGLGDVRIHAHTNSLRLARAHLSQESTSHLLVSFSKGEIKRPCVYGTQQTMTTLVFGPLNMSSADPLVNLRGQEERALRGQDAVYFSNDVWFNAPDFRDIQGPKNVYDGGGFGSALAFDINPRHRVPSLRVRRLPFSTSVLEVSLSKNPSEPQLAVGFVSACENDPAQKNKAYLFPLKFSPSGTIFVLGDDRTKALKAIARQSPYNLRSQIIRGIIEW